MMLFLTIPVNAAVYTYDDANRISTVTFSNGKVLTYTYNDSGNLVSIASNGVELLNIVSIDPVDQASNVSVGKVIEVTFAKEIQSGSNISDITIRQGETATEYTYDINGSKLSLTPTQSLVANTSYTVIIPVGAIQDSMGNTLENNLVFSFTTEAGAAVSGVSLNKTTTTIPVNGIETLVAIVTPENATNKSVTWTSGDEEVAEVDSSGTVTGVGAGEAIITVTTVDGSFTADCEVTVTEAQPIAVTGVSLNKSSISIETGSTETLVATISPENAANKAVTWTSSDEGIATVDSDGTVIGVGAGETIITVTTVDGSFTADCEVTVTEAQPIAVTGVSLNKSSISIETGSTETLVATISPENAANKAVTWTSSDEGIATVDSDGTVTGVGAGEAIITVTTVDGSFTEDCEVTVTEAQPIAVTGVSLNKSSISINTGSTETLMATISPENAANKAVIWTSSDEEIATVDSDGTVTGVGAGETIITVTTVDGSFTATCEVSVL
ncbi:Ig-like domain-containing protein [Candidatus Formimonas warabiya]|uniref:BIG2 domain-containing protein n=1 Tax=Formimonas warabiya TaxID=1761012 RepID=A0A3G1KR67_FORW1|nr:Ig-like domain-containing protein [Candidatus Formimonas warabiya]ATW24936.1 hypothetical protein DCMF_09270 [Candidatus Formimonas warabiya]